jgi:hypothetical protein
MDPTSPSPYSENKRFEPKVPIELNEPKNDSISLEDLSQHDGTRAAKGVSLSLKLQYTEPGVR